ncbi:MAG: SGNH/GDSL hydrolase family protein [Bacteroidales bacterium]|nr:SGNH/GDSL hydrolase family protein [Bacteroidales bacterium]
MKKILFIILSVFLCRPIAAQEYFYTEGSSFTVLGSIFQDNPNPYHRVDTTRYKGFSTLENEQVRFPSGISILFKTDSPSVKVGVTFANTKRMATTMPIAYRGFDLYILNDGRWLFAGSGGTCDGKDEYETVLVKGMDRTSKTCLLYLPIYSEVSSVRIGVEKGSSIGKAESPFKGKIVVYGSSFTQGISTSRAGMAYPSQLMRRTGIEVASLGCGGNCKMQPYFADVLSDAEADLYLFDTFSNTSAQLIEERLETFILRMLAAHPGKPLVFQQTIRREGRNFNTGTEEFEKNKQEMAEKLMKKFVRKYKDVYFIHPDATGPDNEYSVDGTHPDDYGYRLWEQSIEKQVLRIFSKYSRRKR